MCEVIVLIKTVHFKVDKYDTVGLRSTTQMQYSRSESALNKTYLRLETLVMFGDSYKLLRGMKTNNNIFNVTEDYARSFYFPFLDVHFIGKAIVKLNSNYDILSIALSEVDYNSFPIVNVIADTLQNRKKGSVVNGDIPVLWKSVPLTPELDTAVRRFCNTFIY